MTENTKKRITVLGSTGSIGTQTLEAAELLGLKVTALAAGKNIGLLEEQARRFRPSLVAAADEASARELAVRLGDTDIKVAGGKSGVIDAAELETDIVESSIVGVAGLEPTMAAIRCGKRRIALANKETLVCAGRLFMRAIEEHGCELLPVDSEHSAIFQCLMGGRKNELKRILLTASGGPFLNLTKEELRTVTKERALKHPNWDMGAKVTIDSATMMNKGLEVIEAMHLFDVPPERIKVLVHPQSIVHSAVEFVDNSVIAQMGVPDMRLPIQLALTYPERGRSLAAELDLTKAGMLTFLEPDLDKFGCLRLALSVAGRTDAAPVVMNAANEIAVGLFLEDKIGFTDICGIAGEAVEALGSRPADSIAEVLERDTEARELVLKSKEH
ncbi:MAG: 1-deoxy-D-xylulose-5-phosphate reductoisomerase [Oscillospiraceae bacterium]